MSTFPPRYGVTIQNNLQNEVSVHSRPPPSGSFRFMCMISPSKTLIVACNAGDELAVYELGRFVAGFTVNTSNNTFVVCPEVSADVM